ncbi:MAG: 3-hydroxyacyl-CoA dehydrogenase NAD-binding domain-containing protein [Lachnospiraceae bacterium]|nr:3-hydroxyacyl-CoA dehydrogenase NAD-binding domain-containing protein [Lachnospiraceae bacterium]
MAKRIGVVGAGAMGGGIAQVVAQAGFIVINTDANEAVLQTAKVAVRKGMDKLIARGRKTEEEAADIISRISYETSMTGLADCDIVIEAVPEKLELKKQIFKELDQIVQKDALLATNTSALSISAISANMKNPERCVGMHFFFPAPIMKLVEIIQGCRTTDDAAKRAAAFARELGKTPAMAPELPGFLVNRMLVPMQNEAAYLVMEGADPIDVDNAMKLACNHPMGPLELTDFVGVDIMYNTMLALYESYRDSKYRPCPLLANMVAAGLLGRKTGKGFYDYNK